jgi:signal peptidase II
MQSFTKQKLWIRDIVLFIVFIAADQITKLIAQNKLKENPPFEIWPGVFQLRYLENQGAAFGILQNYRIVFIVITLVMLVAVVLLIAKLPTEKQFAPTHIYLTLIAAGGAGNLINRVASGYVVDFFYFNLINFAIFNVADSFISIGAVWLFVHICFVLKDGDLDFLKFRETRKYQTLNGKEAGKKGKGLKGE